jgi:transcriptional regulator with GAF, ATPase, and Fis domain
MERLEPLLKRLREQVAAGAEANEADVNLYEDGLLYYFYYKLYPQMVIATFHHQGKERGRWSFYPEFREEFRRFTTRYEPTHMFACYYQIVRAFHHIFEQIIGNSLPAARLRGAIWQSLFTHDMRRYRRTLYSRMSEFATLITGPSGTGKELVARSVAMSRYIPFDENRLAFQEDLTGLFFPINIAALPGTLVESELFGHKRGSFTGAVQDKRGWLEACPPLGAVFLDEIGDLDPEIQVKLLRVIETRSFQALGEGTAQMHRFQGKLIAATNRDLWSAIRKRRFREDLYYRLCSDQIVTPSLRQQIDESPEVLGDLILFMSRRVAGEEGGTLAAEAQAWVEKNLGPDYGWPGNYRELEQCVRNILIRKDYHAASAAPQKRRNDIFDEARDGSLTANELLSRYCTLMYARTGSYEETARRLEIDRRTVKAKVNAELLERLKSKHRRRPAPASPAN